MKRTAIVRFSCLLDLTFLFSSIIKVTPLLIYFGVVGLTHATENTLTSPSDVAENHFYQAPWGIAIGIRQANVPFKTKHDDVYDVIPLLQYQNDYVFLNGLEAGVHLWKNHQHELNLYSRFRFEDLPKDIQNKTQADAFDLGLQYRFTQNIWQSDLAWMSDRHGRQYGYARTRFQWQKGDWLLEPYAQIEWKSHKFNSTYYGFGIKDYDVSAGAALSGGIKAKYHVTSNLYLLGQFGVSRLEDDIAALPIIDSQYQYQSFLGFGFFPDIDSHKLSYGYSSITEKPKDTGQFVRLSHGWATPSNIGEIFTLSTQSDHYKNQMSSVFYGTRLTKTLFDFPIELYFTPGVAWHQKSSVQDTSYEFIGAIKAFYTFEMGPRWRLGLAEGMSYLTKLTYIEQTEMDEKGYRGSRLLNYLDFSLGVNIGDIFNQTELTNLWLGYNIHHRSGIFETSSAFGRVKGGSNYQNVYLQWNF